MRCECRFGHIDTDMRYGYGELYMYAYLCTDVEMDESKNIEM